MTVFDGLKGGPRRIRRPGLELSVARTMDQVVVRRQRTQYPLLLAAATDGNVATRLYAVGLLRTLPHEDLRPLAAAIEAAGRDASGLTGRLLADLAQVIAAG